MSLKDEILDFFVELFSPVIKNPKDNPDPPAGGAAAFYSTVVENHESGGSKGINSLPVIIKNADAIVGGSSDTNMKSGA
jgi:hypothetical protein